MLGLFRGPQFASVYNDTWTESPSARCLRGYSPSIGSLSPPREILSNSNSMTRQYHTHTHTHTARS